MASISALNLKMRPSVHKQETRNISRHPCRYHPLYCALFFSDVSYYFDQEGRCSISQRVIMPNPIITNVCSAQSELRVIAQNYKTFAMVLNAHLRNLPFVWALKICLTRSSRTAGTQERCAEKSSIPADQMTPSQC